MKRGNTPNESATGFSVEPVSVRMLTSRILELADSGVPRAQFLKELARTMITFSGCDTIRLVLKDRGRFYLCELTGDETKPFLFEVLPCPPGKGAECRWSSGTNDALEKLCDDIINRRTDNSAPWFTPHGSLWTNDITSLSIAGLQKSGSRGGLGIRIDENHGALALIPVESRQKRIGLLQLVSARKDRLGVREIEICEQLSLTFGVALAHQHLQLALRERVKELTCLYGIARLAARPDISLEELLQQAVQLLPPGWLHPDSACARIVLGQSTFSTSNYRKAVQSIKADLVVNGKIRGYVEVGYLWPKPTLDEGPFLSEERNLIDAIAFEVSTVVEQKQAEAERSRLEEKLLHADRLATIGQLGAGLAHELNEPLANILGFAQLVTKDDTLSCQTQKDIAKIISATLHAREVITKLLVFARQTTYKKVRVDLNALVEDGLHFLRSRCAKKGIDVTLDLSIEPAEITADRSQLLQVLTNLIVNSIQAMPNGGSLTIATANDGDHVQLAVEDTGAGMDEEVMKNIFNPFFTTKDVDEGTGLGLSVVHGIVTSHGGRIDVESAVNKGTKFTVRLPLDEVVETKKGDSND